MFMFPKVFEPLTLYYTCPKQRAMYLRKPISLHLSYLRPFSNGRFLLHALWREKKLSNPTRVLSVKHETFCASQFLAWSTFSIEKVLYAMNREAQDALRQESWSARRFTQGIVKRKTLYARNREVQDTLRKELWSARRFTQGIVKRIMLYARNREAQDIFTPGIVKRKTLSRIRTLFSAY